ncbi:MAG: M20/M25/M40 family metallo-hydrolase [Opitutae bacterium]|nr:M20/M25/M40 family metallo-hydrolase [Opitutae bacterium]
MENFDALEILKSYLRYPSVSTDKDFHEGMKGARDFVSELLKNIGFSIELVDTECHPIIFAERFVGEGLPHIVLYGHYDVQPADPLNLWESSPFQPEIRNGRIYGRGSADNKGPTIVHIGALHKVLSEQPDLALNITYVIEGEEEMGSPSMPKFFDRYAERLSKADMMFVSDTGSPTTDQIVITTALRGLVELEIKVKGPKSDLHSGIYGGAVYNPLHALSEIIASLHNKDGSVNIPGFYEGVSQIEQWERDELKRYPMNLSEYKSMLGVPGFYSPRGFTPLEAVRFEPTLEINGMGGGYQGEGTKTIIPSEAFAKITCRLVANQEGDYVQNQVVKAIEDRCPDGVEVEVRRGCFANAYSIIPPNKSESAQCSDFLIDAFSFTDSSISKEFKKSPLYLREGGSIPVIADFKNRAGLDAIMVGLFTPEDNLHAPNESFDIGLMQKATETFANIFRSLGKRK